MPYGQLGNTSILKKRLQREPSRTFCNRRKEDSQSRDPKSIVPDKVRTPSGLGSDDAYREPHSVKALMSCNTARRANPKENTPHASAGRSSLCGRSARLSPFHESVV